MPTTSFLEWLLMPILLLYVCIILSLIRLIIFKPGFFAIIKINYQQVLNKIS